MVIWFLYKMQVGYRRGSRIVGSATSSVWKDPVFRSRIAQTRHVRRSDSEVLRWWLEWYHTLKSFLFLFRECEYIKMQDVIILPLCVDSCLPSKASLTRKPVTISISKYGTRAPSLRYPSQHHHCHFSRELEYYTWV